jgi:hypothetical protein
VSCGPLDGVVGATVVEVPPLVVTVDGTVVVDVVPPVVTVGGTVVLVVLVDVVLVDVLDVLVLVDVLEVLVLVDVLLVLLEVLVLLDVLDDVLLGGGPHVTSNVTRTCCGPLNVQFTSTTTDAVVSPSAAVASEMSTVVSVVCSVTVTTSTIGGWLPTWIVIVTGTPRLGKSFHRTVTWLQSPVMLVTSCADTGSANVADTSAAVATSAPTTARRRRPRWYETSSSSR